MSKKSKKQKRFTCFKGAEVPQADSPQGGQTYVIQHPWPGTEGPLTIKKEGVEQKNAQSNKDSPGDAVVVA